MKHHYALSGCILVLSSTRYCRLLGLVLMTILIGCGADRSVVKPPPSFRESDLIGTWETRSHVDGSQTLIMRADRTFTQRYTLSKGGSPTQVQGTWRLEPRASGCVYVHLEGMRYIYQTVDMIKNGNRSPNGATLLHRERGSAESAPQRWDQHLCVWHRTPLCPAGQHPDVAHHGCARQRAADSIR